MCHVAGMHDVLIAWLCAIPGTVSCVRITLYLHSSAHWSPAKHSIHNCMMLRRCIVCTLRVVVQMNIYIGYVSLPARAYQQHILFQRVQKVTCLQDLKKKEGGGDGKAEELTDGTATKAGKLGRNVH